MFPPSLKNPPRIARNSFIIFAAPLASKPNVINNAGPIIPTRVVATTINFFVPAPKLLNLSNKSAMVWAIGVTASKNVFPIGSRVNFKSWIAALNFVPTAFSKTPSSRSDIIASCSTEFVVKPSTLDACVPSFVTFWNKVERRENWNLPNSCSIARARLSGSSVSNAFEKSITVCLTSP